MKALSIKDRNGLYNRTIWIQSMPNYKVKQGDCVSSIARKYGMFWEKIWNHPKNANLKQIRKNPNVLYLGDEIFIPEKEERQESGATNKRHRFRKKGEPAKLRLRLLDDEEEPRADKKYILEIDGNLFSGTTDSDGRLEHSIPPNAKKGRLIIEENQDEYLLDLGHIDPINEISGIQARLNNLGFYFGAIDGVMGPKIGAALKAFQKKYDLKESGQADEATRKKLLDVHGC